MGSKEFSKKSIACKSPGMFSLYQLVSSTGLQLPTGLCARHVILFRVQASGAVTGVQTGPRRRWDSHGSVPVATSVFRQKLSHRLAVFPIDQCWEIHVLLCFCPSKSAVFGYELF